jgi:hypothetical protein
LQQDGNGTEQKVLGKEFRLKLSKGLAREIFEHGQTSNKGGIKHGSQPGSKGQEVNGSPCLGR